MFRCFFPDETADSAYGIDYEGLYREGFRGIIFDIDNTLVPHGADADERAEELFKRLKKIGFQVCLLSNNKRERVDRFNAGIRVHSIFDAHKPSGENYKKAMGLMSTGLSDTLFIGDQLFTDVYGAKRMRIKNILVRPIDKKEEIQIVLKRYLERIVLYFYRKEGERKE